jgi:hypothetical protein
MSCRLAPFAVWLLLAAAAAAAPLPARRSLPPACLRRIRRPRASSKDSTRKPAAASCRGGPVAAQRGRDRDLPDRIGAPDPGGRDGADAAG